VDKTNLELNTAVWDRDSSLKRLMGKEDLLNTVTEIFIMEAPDRINEIQQAVDSGDCEIISRVAHTIKGVAANISGLELQKVAADIESNARQGEMNKVLELFPELIAANERLIQEIKKN